MNKSSAQTKPKKAPTMKDVAKLAGVGTMTVSRAFKSGEYVSEETKTRVLKAAEELGYVMNSTAGSLSSQKTGFVAVIIPSINNANFAETVRGISETLRDSGLQIILGYSNYDVQEEEKLVAELLSRRPEAMVLTGGTHSERCTNLLRNANIPIIETWDDPEKPIEYSVGFSNRDSAGILLDHLMAKGAKKICFVGGDDHRDTRGFQRREGFIEEVQKRKFEEVRLIDLGPPPVAMQQGVEAVSLFKEQWPDSDAVMCVSDLVAFGFVSGCQRAGIAVPQDLLVAGFGDYDIAEICVPGITTVDAKAEMIGIQAGTIVRRLLVDKLPDPPRRKRSRIKLELLARESTDI